MPRGKSDPPYILTNTVMLGTINNTNQCISLSITVSQSPKHSNQVCTTVMNDNRRNTYGYIYFIYRAASTAQPAILRVLASIEWFSSSTKITI